MRRAEKETDATVKNFKASYATGKRKSIRLSIMTGNAWKAVATARMGRLNSPFPSPFLLIISMYRF